MTAMGKMAWGDPAKGDPAKNRIPLHKFAGEFAVFTMTMSDNISDNHARTEFPAHIMQGQCTQKST